MFLFWWRLKDYRLTLISNQPYVAKPLITKKIALTKNLTIEDLSFIYERPIEYELDKETLQLVLEYRVKNKLPLNPNYEKEVRLNLEENLSRKKLF